MNKEFEKIKPKIIEILKKNGVARAGIFGSYARGKQKKGSDIDILIEVDDDFSLFDLVGLKLELEKKINKKIDISTYKAINRLLRKHILSQEVRIIE